jgi:hypothetical protein
MKLISLAIVIAAAIISGSFVLVNRYEMFSALPGTIILVDRLTGRAEGCQMQAGGGLIENLGVICKPVFLPR